MTDSEQPDQAPVSIDLSTLLEVMQTGELALEGLMPWSSNYTFLGTISANSVAVPVVYKPQRGERPLWDFPEGSLYKREVAAYLVSAALGWNLVPPTVARSGPHGVGSAQLFINADYDEHYFTLKERYPDQFRRIALFDLVINNADRKGGHVLLDDDEHVWAIDHGIAFHDEYKLRTVIWEYVGQALAEDEQAALRQLQEQLQDDQPLAQALAELLFPREIAALQSRLNALIKRGAFPGPRGSRAMPWPPV